ncbi:MAG: hypothetical protein AAGI53_17620 [Planctomycetota bacterium]
MGGRPTSVNPFRERLRQRQAAMGGKHAPSTVGGHLFNAEEFAVAMAREAQALQHEFVSPF